MAARRYCFTSFDVDAFRMNFNPSDEIRYMCCQLEIAPSTGEQHIQGYIELSKPMRYSGVQKLLGDPHAHCEQARGTSDDNIKYCTKEEGRAPEDEYFCIIYGKASVQGTRTDIHDFIDKAKTGATDRLLLDDHPTEFLKYNKALTAIRGAMAAPRSTKPKVSIYWGPTGTGERSSPIWLYSHRLSLTSS